MGYVGSFRATVSTWAGAENPGRANQQQKSKETTFPESTKYRIRDAPRLVRWCSWRFSTSSFPGLVVRNVLPNSAAYANGRNV